MRRLVFERLEREVCVNRVCGWVDPSVIKGVCDLEYESVRCCVQGQAEMLWAVDNRARRSLCAEHSVTFHYSNY